ncbi:WEB family protein At1g75720 [Andrographis paniculata]|uniref:WEB family protein At1g75720 n=1 Tax=Andrographis paniculata TaxID=175694 RepID=UPI0021E879EF|nr:WEB family protein At1g75720 [Andrographis paniculata]
MEEQQQSNPPDNDDLPERPAVDYHSNVDTSRPFRSVKEAVAIFGERILLPEIHNPKPFTFPKKETPFYSPSPRTDDKDHRHDSNYSSPRGSTYSINLDGKLSDTVKKLKAELEDTKAELKLLKERESETEVALASLNAELHKNMSKLALAEAAMAKKAAGDVIREEEKKRDAYLRMESSDPSPRLAQILSIGENEGLFVGKKKERKAAAAKKKKPIIPLVGELFARKKGASATSLQNPLYASSHLQWN